VLQNKSQVNVKGDVFYFVWSAVCRKMVKRWNYRTRKFLPKKAVSLQSLSYRHRLATNGWTSGQLPGPEILKNIFGS